MDKHNELNQLRYKWNIVCKLVLIRSFKFLLLGSMFGMCSENAYGSQSDTELFLHANDVLDR